jgi:hypothetical protein
MRLFRVTDGNRTYWHWSGEFELEPQDAAEMLKLIEAPGRRRWTRIWAPCGASEASRQSFGEGSAAEAR